jgi:hypothetical protein
MAKCPDCKAQLPKEKVGTGFFSCPGCNVQIKIDGFSENTEELPGLPPLKNSEVQISESDKISCFFHPLQQAVVSCDFCGRFLCTLCELSFKNATLCPTCLEGQAAPESRKIKELSKGRTMWDAIALALCFFPVIMPFFFYLAIFTAPAAFFIAIRFFRRKLSLAPRLRWRFYLAGIVSLCQILGMFFLGINLMDWT